MCSGAAVNLFNPKTMLSFTVLLPQFLGGITGNPVPQLLMLGLILQMLGLITDLAIGYAAGAGRDRLLRHTEARSLL